jgi:hypothetical protein
MRVSNEPGGTGPGGAFAELFRLQSDFQARLAEETLRYLRRLQGAVVPAAPGTVVMPAAGGELKAAGEPGGRVELSVEIENLQRVHCMVTPQLTPLVSTAGVTWFPAAELTTASRLVAPGGVERIVIPLPIPAELPPGDYRGALLLQGFRQNTLAVAVTVAGAMPDPEPAAAAMAAASSKAASKKTASKKTASKKTASKKTASKKTATKKTASKQLTSKQVTSKKKSSTTTPSRKAGSKAAAKKAAKRSGRSGAPPERRPT